MSDNDIYHFGVKGMKWGVRKQYVPSRKETRAVNKQRKNDFYTNRTERAIKTASKLGDKAMIATRVNPYDSVATVMTGKEFIAHVKAGGTFDNKMTAVYASQSKKNGAYVIDDHYQDRFKKTSRKELAQERAKKGA